MRDNTSLYRSAALVACLLLSVSQNLPAGESDRLSVTQWVTTDRDGQIKVQVVVPELGGGSRRLSGARVRLLGPEGNSQTANADDSGVATFANVAAGVYAIVADSEGVFGCYSIHIVSAASENSKLYPTLAVVSCGLESRARFSEAVDQYFPLAYELKHLQLDSGRLNTIVDHVRGNELFRVTRLGESMVGYIYQPTDHGSTSDPQDRDGRLDPSERANVFLYQGGRRIRHQISDHNGRFEFKYLSTGIYSLITVGPDGIGAVGFELIDPIGNSSALASDGNQFIATRSATCCEFALQVVPCCEPLSIAPESCCEPIVCCEVACCEVGEAIPASPVSVSAGPVAGGGATTGGIGGSTVANPPLAGIATAVTVALLTTNSDGNPPYQTPSPASPDTLGP